MADEPFERECQIVGINILVGAFHIGAITLAVQAMVRLGR